MTAPLWHRVAEHGQPPLVDLPKRIAWRDTPDSRVSLCTERFRGGDPDCWLPEHAEWCVVDLPTGYAPKPLRNGWQPMVPPPPVNDPKDMVLVANERGGIFSVFANGLDAEGARDAFVAWRPLPAGPYDEPEGA